MGIYLEAREIERSNEVMIIINKIISENPSIKYWVCPKCRGTGLSSIQGSLFWDGLFCEECKGVSKRLEDGGLYSKCTNCNGSGRISKNIYPNDVCPKCKGYGHLDWLENITGIRNKR